MIIRAFVPVWIDITNETFGHKMSLMCFAQYSLMPRASMTAFTTEPTKAEI